jgi:DNA-binding HxlR family transcriptional regulator
MAESGRALRLTGVLDPRDGWTADRCTIAKALEVVSTRSSFLILREAFYGAARFDDFARRVGISEPVAAARLRDLVDEGLLTREDYRDPGQRTRQSYRLTDKGADLFPALAALMQWGDRWLDEAGGPVVLQHRDCGKPVSVLLRCSAGHSVSLDDMDLALHQSAARGRSLKEVANT